MERRHCFRRCSWTVVCPPKLKKYFEGICCAVTFDELDLTVSLRSHLAEDVTKWVKIVC